jgi:DNA-binding beta-propeller fold protein YncE
MRKTLASFARSISGACLLLCASLATAAPTLLHTIDIGAWQGTPATSILTPIPAPLFPGFSLTSIAYDPLHQIVYVADSNTANVYQINATTNAVATAVNTQGLGTPTNGLTTIFTPRTVLVNPAANRWAVTGRLGGGEFTGTTWLLLDGVPLGSLPSGAVWDAVTNNIYQAGTEFFATQNLKYVYAGFPCSGTSNTATINPMTSRVYVSCGFSDFNAGIFVFDGIELSKANANTTTLQIGNAVIGHPQSGALGMAVNPNTNLLYAVGLTAPGVLDVLDASTYKLVTSIPGIPNQTGSVIFSPGLNVAVPQPVAVNSLTDTIFVLNSLSSTITVIDGHTNTVTGSIVVPSSEVVQTNAEIKIGNTVFDASQKVIRTLGGAVSMAVNEAHNLLYVATVNGKVEVYALDPAVAAPQFSANGVIANTAGVVQPGITVTATAAGITRTATTDARGMFVLTGLTNGSYTVKPAAAAFSFAPQTVAVASANVGGLKFTAFPPFFPSSYTLSPWTMIGTSVVTTGTVKLNQPAPAGGVVVTLTASDPKAVKIPATVSIAAGQTTVSFPVQGNGVSAVTNVTLLATGNGGTAKTSLTVAPGDTVKITTVTWSSSTKLLSVTATGSNAAATLQAQNGNTGVILGTMKNLGNGSYSYQQTIATGVPTSINIVSNLGAKTGKGVTTVP